MLKRPALFCVLCEQNDSMQMIFTTKYFLFTAGSVCRVKRFTTGKRKAANNLLMTKSLKRKCRSDWVNSQNLLWCGFRRTGKAIRKVYQCWLIIRMSRNKPFFFRFEYLTLYVLYPFVTYLINLPRIVRKRADKRNGVFKSSIYLTRWAGEWIGLIWLRIGTSGGLL
jgi:hypothetical protein